MSYIYIPEQADKEKTSYAVGYTLGERFMPIEEGLSLKEAELRVNYLNGGSKLI